MLRYAFVSEDQLQSLANDLKNSAVVILYAVVEISLDFNLAALKKHVKWVQFLV